MARARILPRPWTESYPCPHPAFIGPLPSPQPALARPSPGPHPAFTRPSSGSAPSVHPAHALTLLRLLGGPMSRFLKHGPVPHNYGCLPQTWEDPSVRQTAENLPGLSSFGRAHMLTRLHTDMPWHWRAAGDNDPIDVIEVGSRTMRVGDVVEVPHACNDQSNRDEEGRSGPGSSSQPASRRLFTERVGARSLACR